MRDGNKKYTFFYVHLYKNSKHIKKNDICSGKYGVLSTNWEFLKKVPRIMV